jgi:uncharacterized caspase-like protein
MISKHAASGLWRLPFAAAILLASLTTSLLASCSFTSQEITTPTNRYALVIGVQDYPDSANDSSDLKYTDDDAADLADLLTTQGWIVSARLISSSDTNIETDGSPTYANIKAAIDALPTNEDSTILVYFSGHGSTEDGIPYIIPYDGLTTEETPYYGTYYQDYDQTKWITPSILKSWMEAVPAKNRVLILDSCYSGGFTGDANAEDTAPDDYSLKYGTSAETGILPAALANFNSLVAGNLASLGARDTIALSACGSDEESYDGTASMANGVFTYYLLLAANYGDSDGDGLVTVAEAYAYAKKQIKDNWNSAYYRYDEDFLPHISGGTGDIALYVPEN